MSALRRHRKMSGCTEREYANICRVTITHDLGIFRETQELNFQMNRQNFNAAHANRIGAVARLLAFLALPISTVLLADDKSAVVKSEFIFETAPFPQCHASTIAESKNALVAAWFGGKHEKSPE